MKFLIGAILLPVSPLDSGHIATAIMERLRVPKKVISGYKIGGFIIFIAFVTLVIGNDIYRLFLK